MTEEYEQVLAKVPGEVKEAPGDRDWAAEIYRAGRRKQNKALSAAAGSGHLWRVHFLLNIPKEDGGFMSSGNGVDPNCSSARPLRKSCWNGHSEVVRTLLDHGADPNITYDSISPLRRAAQRGHVDIVRLLVDHGADISWNNYTAVNGASGAVKGYFRDLLGQDRNGKAKAGTTKSGAPANDDAKSAPASSSLLWEKVNDFTVSSYSWNGSSTFSLRRVFNFKSREVGSIYYEVDRDGDAHMMSASQTVRFSELEDEAEIVEAHAHLERLGGTPGTYTPSRVVNKIKSGG